MDDCCEDHGKKFSPKKHPDHGKAMAEIVPDHARGAPHPQHHTSGQMRSQMNPDHGPHK